MIYTVTLNPAIDLVILTNELKPDVVNRTKSFELQPNGKGVNVSFMLKKMNIDSIATGIGGGFTLDYVCQGLKNKKINTKFLKVEQPTRVNVFTRVISENVEYKEVNPGPTINAEVQKEYLKYLQNTLEPDDYIVISGSFSKGINPLYLKEIARIVSEKQGKLIIDTSYSEAMKTLKYHPFLLKPNESELASWFNISRKLSEKEIIDYSQKLIEQGASNILVSRGSKGAVLVNKECIYIGNAPRVSAVNTAGAGDTMLATFIGKLKKNHSYKEALKYALAAGSDTASGVGLSDLDNLDELMNQINIRSEKNDKI